jgi:hypothetical protein
MIKALKIVFPTLMAIAVLAVCMSPRIQTKTKAIPGNLWTSPGHWSKPSRSQQVEEWERWEIGRPWSWLVIDTGISVDAWYARLDLKYFALYILFAAIAGIVSAILMKRIKIPKKTDDT